MKNTIINLNKGLEMIGSKVILKIKKPIKIKRAGIKLSFKLLKNLFKILISFLMINRRYTFLPKRNTPIY